MKSQEQNYIYVYDEDKNQIIIINSENGETVEEKDDDVTSLLKHLRDQTESSKLRKFAVWCAYQTNENIKPIQNKIIELAERAIEGEASDRQLKELYEETEGAAVATDTVGLRQGSEKAPAFLATRECINPDAFEGAKQAARFHRLWEDIKSKDSDDDQSKILRNIKASTDSPNVKDATQKQINYLLDLMNK